MEDYTKNGEKKGEFTKHMEKEAKTLEKYITDAQKTFGKSFKVSIDLKDT